MSVRKKTCTAQSTNVQDERGMNSGRDRYVNYAASSDSRHSRPYRTECDSITSDGQPGALEREVRTRR